MSLMLIQTVKLKLESDMHLDKKKNTCEVWITGTYKECVVVQQFDSDLYQSCLHAFRQNFERVHLYSIYYLGRLYNK